VGASCISKYLLHVQFLDAAHLQHSRMWISEIDFFYQYLYIASFNLQRDQAKDELKKQWCWGQTQQCEHGLTKVCKIIYKIGYLQNVGKREGQGNYFNSPSLSEFVSHLADGNVSKPKFWKNSSNTEMAHHVLKSSPMVLRFLGERRKQTVWTSLFTTCYNQKQ
jgi:hypothetical protein